MEIGAVYAIWSAVGTALVSVLGVIVFHEPANTLKIVAIVLIIVGVVCLNLSSRQSSRAATRTRTQLHSELRLDIATVNKTVDVSAPQMAISSVQSTTGR
jgi:drug/metabolite transporter (DMT)-like permease